MFLPSRQEHQQTNKDAFKASFRLGHAQILTQTEIHSRLTEFRDAAHCCGQQTLLHAAQVRLTVGVPLAALPHPLLLRLLLLLLKDQSLGQTEHTWGRNREMIQHGGGFKGEVM